jgi:hypothetical protein
MRKGVVIGCVGVVAAAAIAVVVYTQPQPSAANSDLLPANVAARTPATAPHKFARAATPAAKPAAKPEVAPVQSGALPIAYRVLLTRSIFCPHGVAEKASVKTSEPTLTLRGVVQWRRGFIAFIENSASGESRIVKVGDTIGQKKVINIDFHSVEFVEGKRAMKVAVGQTLGSGLSSSGNNAALATARPQLD